LATYLGEYAGNRIGGQSAYDAYRNISAERQAFGLEQRIRAFLADQKEILRKSGIELTPDELKLIENELGAAIW
jgi:hypothetical protein